MSGSCRSECLYAGLYVSTVVTVVNSVLQPVSSTCLSPIYEHQIAHVDLAAPRAQMAPLYTSSALGDKRSRAPEFAKDEGPLPSPSWHLFRILDSAMSATDHLPSTLGPYHLQDRLGEGGMGVVHLARDPQGGLVAIKVLRPNTMESANARLRLVREVESMRRVRSAFVAEVLDADVTGEFPYIVTRYVPGPTLEAMVRSRGPLSGSGLRKLVYGTAEALAAIHAAGVVHRNLRAGQRDVQ